MQNLGLCHEFQRPILGPRPRMPDMEVPPLGGGGGGVGSPPLSSTLDCKILKFCKVLEITIQHLRKKSSNKSFV